MVTAQQLPSGNWRCLAYGGKTSDGKIIRTSFTAATKYAAERLAVLYGIHRHIPYSEGITWGEAFSAYMKYRARTFSPSTLQVYHSYHRNYFSELSDCPIEHLSDVALQEYFLVLSHHLSQKTVADIRSFFKNVLLFAGLSCSRLHLPKQVRSISQPLPKEDVDDLMTIFRCFADLADTRLYTALYLAAHVGLRRSDLCRLQWSDVDFAKNRICLSGRKGHLFGKYIIPISPKVSKELSDIYHETMRRKKAKESDGRPLLRPYCTILDWTPNQLSQRFRCFRKHFRNKKISLQSLCNYYNSSNIKFFYADCSALQSAVA